MDPGCSSGDGEKGSDSSYILKAELTWIPVRLNIKACVSDVWEKNLAGDNDQCYSC